MTVSTAFGPQGPNYTTTRPPADPKASAGSDTWFKNCSAAGAKDGTFATADFFNVTLGNLRYLCRTAGVTLDDATDTMVYQAVLNMINAAIGTPGTGGPPTVGTVPYGNPTLYVRTDGDDTHDGSANDAAHAFKTIQAAINYAQNVWSLGGKILNIQLGNPGTYTGYVSVSGPMTGVKIKGDPNNQATYVITPPATDTSSSQAVYAGSASLILSGVTVTMTRTDLNFIIASYGGSILLDHVTVQAGATTAYYALGGVADGTINIAGPVNIQGNFGAAFFCQAGGNVTVQVGATVTFVATPAFSVGTIYLSSCGTFSLVGSLSGAATGPFYYIYQNGAAQTFGKTIPGSSAGTTATGGQFS